MNEATLLKSHTMKVNKFTIIISFLGSIACLLLAVLSILSTYFPSLVLMISSCICTILTYKKIPEKNIMLVLLFFLYAFICLLIIDLPNSVTVFIMLGLCFSSTYFRKWNVLIYGIFSSGILIVLQIVKDIYSYQDFFIQLSCFLFCTTCLFLLTKWGVKLIRDATVKEEQASTLLFALQKTMETINSNTIALNNDIAESNTNLKKVQEASNGIIATVQQVTQGVIEQAESTSEINNMMSDAEEKISEVLKYTKNLSEISSIASSVVTEGSEKIIDMEKQMTEINISSRETLSTVEELQSNMDEIITFLSCITQIAEQTNLLALNAAIEAIMRRLET